MSDKREEILVRLKEILGVLAGDPEHASRNRAEFDDNELPMYSLLDGDEHKGMGNTTDRRAPPLMVITPQIFWVPRPPDNRTNEGLGEATSAQRVNIVYAVMTDSKLADLVGANGYVDYLGMESDLKTGAELAGQIRTEWAIGFVQNFTKLKT